MTDSEKRRKAILEYLSSKASPVNGTELAGQFGVSRQVIVQDIAILRAENRNILSTNKGYMLFHPRENRGSCTAALMVKHTAEQTIEELLAIVDYGGRMLDVFVDHDLYGQIRVDLVINNAGDAGDFCEKMARSHCKPLKVLTEDYHYHTIEAPSEKALNMIKKELKEKGFLPPCTDPQKLD